MKYNYPTTYEIKEILSFATRGFLNEFAQKKGLFISNASTTQLIAELSNLFFDEVDLEKIRSVAYGIVQTHTLTGFIFKSNNSLFNLKVTYDNIREQGKYGTDIKLNELVNINRTTSNPVYKGSMEYIRQKPGRIEFMKEEKSSFDFYIGKVRPGVWQVEIDCNKSADSKELKEIFISYLPMDDHAFETIDESLITVPNSIVFFDELAKIGMGKDWRFVTVEHLAIKKDKPAKKIKEEDFDDEDDSIESSDTLDVFEEELTGINKAIIEGKDIRKEEFVDSCVKKGFRFSAMTYQFEHKKQPLVISVTAEFKGRPKFFEVGISKISESTGLYGTKEPGELPSDENRTLRSVFWNNAKKVYDNLKNFKPVNK